ncbi:MAG: CysB family HTH-type transcriptional regulator [Betaproteobacteria bacterium]|nr:CysB family HTH-type transcriptional regulator [Betaproteobacteria bacterium]
MNFQQLRSVREAIQRNFNLTEVAEALFTSQPGVSRQIRELEDELGVAIFERRGKRLTGLTEPGKEIARIIERLLGEQDNLRCAGEEFANQTTGRLTIATTHTQARYALPPVIRGFRKRYPQVRLHLQQSAPDQIARSVLEGKADLGIATEALEGHPELVAFPSYPWNHIVVVPAQHPLLQAKVLTLPLLAKHPLITYEAGFTGRPHIDEAFAKQLIEPEIVLTAMDADVIKTYVADGLGVGIIASMAFEPEQDKALRALEAKHLFPSNMTRLAMRRGAYLRGFAYAFIELFAPQLTRAAIDKAMQGEPEDYAI